MSYEDVRNDEEEPSIVDMTETAIKMLSKNKENGFFLMVEGSNIDHAHHGSRVSTSITFPPMYQLQSSSSKISSSDFKTDPHSLGSTSFT